MASIASTPADGGRATLAGIAAVCAALLMTELALTRIFSVTMYYHFAFLAISIALFGLSASSVLVYVLRHPLASIRTSTLLSGIALAHGVATLVALAALVRLRVGLNYSTENLVLMLAIYALASLPFVTGGAIVALAFARQTRRINLLYAADLLGASAGCLVLIPLLNQLGAPGVVLVAAALSVVAAVCFATRRAAVALAAAVILGVPLAAQAAGLGPFAVADTKGHVGDRVLFSKWNSFSRVAVYDRPHGDWSLSPRFTGTRGESLFMDIDSAASTPILEGTGRPEDAGYLRYELTAFAYHFVPPGDVGALVIGPGGGRDLLTALAFGASRVDGVEINPIIVRDVMLGRFREYSGNLYQDPRIAIHIDDGRSFVRRSTAKYDVIQASLVDTWAATAAGAYTLTENSLYTVEAFGEYLDHLTDRGVLTITRWVFDGLRLVSLAQEACAERGLDPARHIAVVRHDRVATFLLKKSPFTETETHRLRSLAAELGFEIVYAPGVQPSGGASHDPVEMVRTGTSVADYTRLIQADDRDAFVDAYPLDIRPTTDDRPFFFHTTRLANQFGVAFGRSMLFGNGLSALLTLFGISAALVVLFIVGPLLVGGRRPGAGWGRWLAYFGALGAGFMLLEVAILQRFVLLLGHPVYSLTVTLFSLLLGTGAGSLISRRVSDARVGVVTRRALLGVLMIGLLTPLVLPALVDMAVPWPLEARIAVAVLVLVPLGMLLGIPLPGGMRLLAEHRPEIVAWGWGMNGAFSVIGATLAVFIAMNWGFTVTFLTAAAVYGAAAVTLTTRPA